jgi:hypothetical protein
MRIKGLVIEFATAFAVTLIVSVAVTLLWNLSLHGIGTIDWETSIRTAILLGILVPWIGTRRPREK